ncbi:C-type lectin domain family 2 member D-like [Trachemys scripta elegans]|uniref:C-type lectin domain family 2 member D-like n=1 Tax=Trachemys scripta elegans TaxID=31138 RepID=UPI000CE64869|nr:C-type lectin domain family 2 member D-like [Chrysemys picta bellii]XP_023967621.1 C-type lectin domain family 2 member D-like [Chrysemys picta bellii]XP_034613518.1 C-type lectin domain family 2 member D-like [Trachemys scripta elegans]XP_034613519.1 C-type lectin domain family 2 member D-like [Trachemys scripta elegans]XP_042703944.1 C-type lectin domain family 2 member D-like [Chrysemys picta bellii]XP_042703945.1 C-type lectin domain family 2 member D-like [Chrysemys picta bellii]XP_04
MEEGECSTNDGQQMKAPLNQGATGEKRREQSYCNRLDRDTEACPEEGTRQTAMYGCSKQLSTPVSSEGTGPGSNRLRKRASRQVPVPAVVLAAVTVFMLIAIIIVITLAVLLAVEKSKPPVAVPGPPAVPGCPDGWIGYRGKCYYFSETEGNWTYSQSQCSALNASLAGIDSDQEKDFLLRFKGFFGRWIGLQRKPGQPWRWPNGTKFDNRFPIGGGGDCAYVIDDNGVSSSRCSTGRSWICSKPDAHIMGKGHDMES